MDAPITNRRWQQAAETAEPIIEVDGELQFNLPGMPVFPALTDETILKPELSWQLQSSNPGKLDAELCYVSGRHELGGRLQSCGPGGRRETRPHRLGDHGQPERQEASTNARVKLMAGDVSKIEEDQTELYRAAAMSAIADAAGPPVTEKAFDEYHLYTLQRPLTLRDRETKQVEFVRTSAVGSERVYVYDGASIDWDRWRGYDPSSLRQNDALGTAIQSPRCGSCASSRTPRKTASAFRCRKDA